MKNNKVWIKLLVVLLIDIKMIAMEPAWHESKDGKRFLIDTEEKYNWYQAWNECARYDAQLVAIEDEAKNYLVMKLLRNLPEKTKNLWTGGNVVCNKVSLLWAVNEQPITFTNWATNNLDKLAFKNQCIYLMSHRKNFPWSIANCDAEDFGFVCEEIKISEELQNAKSNGNSEILKQYMPTGTIYGLIG